MMPNMLWLAILTTIKGLYIPQRTGGSGVETRNCISRGGLPQSLSANKEEGPVDPLQILIGPGDKPAA